MKDEDMPAWLPKRDGSTPLLTAYELGFWKCPKCRHNYRNKSEIAQCLPQFSEWEHFIWCSYCKEQFPAMLWMASLEAQEKKFLQHIEVKASESAEERFGNDSPRPPNSANDVPENACPKCGSKNNHAQWNFETGEHHKWSKPDLRGYTRYPKANGGGVWIKNEDGIKKIKQICGHELYRRGIVGGEGRPHKFYCLDCEEEKLTCRQEVDRYGHCKHDKCEDKNCACPKGDNKYVYAYDPIIKRRVVHLIVKRRYTKWAVSMITGHTFRMPKERK